MTIPKQEAIAEDRDRRIMEAIKQKDVRMRPRAYFVLRALFIALCILLLFFLLLYVVSLIIFALHQNGVWFAPNFGASGWSVLISALPWGLLLLSFILLIFLANLLKRYAFIYHQPLFYFLFGFIVLTMLGGFFLAAELQPGLFQYAAGNVPVLGSLYRYETALPASVHRGEIVSFNADGSFVVMDGLGVTSTVVAAQGVVFLQEFHVGDTVLVFGTRGTDGTIRAFGIQRIGIATTTPAATAGS